MPKLNKDSTLNITFVGIGLCLLCSAIISIIAIQLRSIQENNVVLDKGKVIEQGTHDDLIKKKGVYNNLISLQSLS